MCAQVYVSAFNDKKVDDLHSCIFQYLVCLEEIVGRLHLCPQIADLVPADYVKLKTVYSVNPYDTTECSKVKDKDFTNYGLYLLINYALGIPEVIAYVDRVYDSIKYKYDFIKQYLTPVDENDIIAKKFNDANTYAHYATRDSAAHAMCIAYLEKENEHGLPKITFTLELFKKCIAVAYKYFLISYSFDKTVQLTTTSKSIRYAAFIDCKPDELEVLTQIFNQCLKAPAVKAPAKPRAAGTKRGGTKKKEETKSLNAISEDSFDVDDEENI